MHSQDHTYQEHQNRIAFLHITDATLFAGMQVTQYLGDSASPRHGGDVGQLMRPVDMREGLGMHIHSHDKLHPPMQLHNMRMHYGLPRACGS